MGSLRPTFRVSLVALAALVATGVFHSPAEGHRGPAVADTAAVRRFLHELNETHGEAGIKRIKAAIDARVGDMAGINCAELTAIIATGRFLIRNEATLQFLLEHGCTTFKIQDARVCRGIGELFGPPLFYIFHNSKLSSKEMASILLGRKACGMKGEEWSRSNLNWSIDVPARPPVSISGRPQPVDQGPTRFLHISDIHLDLGYTEGTNAQCGEPLCCRAPSIASPDGSSGSKAGYYGNVQGECDAPITLGENALKQIAAAYNQSNPKLFDYGIWTGDITPHNVWSTSADEVRNTSRTWSKLLSKYLPKEVPFFPVLGNHEAHPVNMFTPPEITNNLSNQWIYKELYTQWSQWIGNDPDISATFLRAGFYAKNITDRLLFIGLNTNLCSKENYWQLYDPADQGGQLKWLAQTLALAEQRGQHVHIGGHIPPSGECTDTWLHHYMQLLTRFNETITGQFFGHTHNDEIRVYLTGPKNAVPIAGGLVGGSITTYGYVNPCYRIITADSKGSVLDADTYYLNITEANLQPSKANWRHEYTATTSYGLTDLSKEQLNSLYKRLQTDKDLQKSYFEHYHRFSDSQHWIKDCTNFTCLNGIAVTDPLGD